MSDNSTSEFGAFLAGFVIGGLVGAAAALVLAPQSGSETRSQLVGMGQDLRQAGSDRVHQVRDGADDYLQRAEQSLGEAGDEVQEQTRIVLDSGARAADKAQENLNQLADDISDTTASN